MVENLTQQTQLTQPARKVTEKATEGSGRCNCRNSGTWGSPNDAKVEPTPSVPPEDQQEAKTGPEMGRPISARRPDQHNRPPEGEWVASGSNLSPGPR